MSEHPSAAPAQEIAGTSGHKGPANLGEPTHDCGICLQPLSGLSPDGEGHASLDGCSHLFCFDCITRWARIRASCPLCRCEFRLVTSSKLGPNGEKRSLRYETVQSSEDEDEGFNEGYETEGYYIEESSGDEPLDSRRLSRGGVFSQSEDESESEEDSEDEGFVVPDGVIEFEEGATSRGGIEEEKGEEVEEDLTVGTGALFELPQTSRRTTRRVGESAREAERRRSALEMLESGIQRARTRPSFRRPTQTDSDEVVRSGWFAHRDTAEDVEEVGAVAVRQRRAAATGGGSESGRGRRRREGAAPEPRVSTSTRSRGRRGGRRNGGDGGDGDESPELRVRRRAVDVSGAFSSFPDPSIFAYRRRPRRRVMAASGALDGGSSEQLTARTEGGSSSNGGNNTERMTAVVQGGESEGMTAVTGGGVDEREQGGVDEREQGGVDEREQGGIEGGIGVSAGADGEEKGGSRIGIKDSVNRRSVQTSRSTSGHERGSSSSSSSSSSLDVRGADRRGTEGGIRIEGGEGGKMEDLSGSHGGCEAGSRNLIKVVEWGREKEEGDADESGAKGCSQREGVGKESLDQEDPWFAPGHDANARGEQGRERDAKGDSDESVISSSSAGRGGGGWLAKLKRCVDTSKACENAVEGIEGDESVAKRLKASNGLSPKGAMF